MKFIVEDVQFLSHAFCSYVQHNNCPPNCLFQHTRAYSIPHSYTPCNTINMISSTTVQGCSITIILFNCNDIFHECSFVINYLCIKIICSRLKLKVFLLEYFILESYRLEKNQIYSMCMFICISTYMLIYFVLLITC